MKKLMIGLLVLLIALAACTATGGTVTTEEATATPTEVSLEPAPTATDESTAEPTATDIPTATATPVPEPTETAVPTATETPPENTPEGTIPESVEFPDGAVIIFTRTGGFAGFNDTWVFYEDGRATLNGVDQSKLTPEKISDVMNQLEALGFFEISYFTEPGTICCDFFDYTIAARTPEMQNFAGYSDGDQNAPSNLVQSGSLILNELVQEAQQQ
ncbi:MAG: hypothetical protein WAM60_18640 [Candidatus Promineifilaceae bacterium]